MMALDLSRLHHRRKGKVPCPFHDDDRRSPALSVDVDRELYYCFRCGAKGGPVAFRKLLNGDMSVTAHATGRWVADPFRDAYRATRRLIQEHGEMYAAADELRNARRLVDDARTTVTRLGDCEGAWDLADTAAQLERELHCDEDAWR